MKTSARIKRLPLIRPGEILAEDLADVAVSLNEVEPSLQYWMNLQSAYDLAVAERNKGYQRQRDVTPRRAA